MRRCAIFLVLIFAVNWPASADPVDEAFQKLTSLNRLRESLASTLDHRKEPITEETFKQVCAPVGQALKRWGEEKGYGVRQVSLKNRNPAHAPNSEEEKVLALFTRNSSLERHIDSQAADGTRLYVRIPVTSSCLHCHGEKSARPEFIKMKYKDDKAHGYKAGDLRGIYTVFLPKQ